MLGLACRDNPGKNGLSRVDSMALAANAASIARMHDSGRTVDPNRDISHQYRPHRGYSGSHHGGNLFFEAGGSLHNQTVGGSNHKKKGLPRNYSDGTLVRAQSLGQNRQVQLVTVTPEVCLLVSVSCRSRLKVPSSACTTYMLSCCSLSLMYICDVQILMPASQLLCLEMHHAWFTSSHCESGCCQDATP